MSLISLDFSDTQSNHDSLFSILSTLSISNFQFLIKKDMIDGSISPDLVHIIIHSNGVNHMEVSNTFQFWIAVMLAQFHR
jgi:hypothetical protein